MKVGLEKINNICYDTSIIFENQVFMNLLCPECKNVIDLSKYPNLQVDQIVECEMCGINLQIVDLSGDTVKAEIVDEGK